MVADEYRADDVVLLARRLLIAVLLRPVADAISDVGEQFIGFDEKFPRSSDTAIGNCPKECLDAY